MRKLAVKSWWRYSSLRYSATRCRRQNYFATSECVSTDACRRREKEGKHRAYWIANETKNTVGQAIGRSNTGKRRVYRSTKLVCGWRYGLRCLSKRQTTVRPIVALNSLNETRSSEDRLPDRAVFFSLACRTCAAYKTQEHYSCKGFAQADTLVGLSQELWNSLFTKTQLPQRLRNASYH